MSRLAPAALLLIAAAGPALGQARTVRQTATTYGARLNATAEPANLNSARLNNRVESRLNSRLGLRVERFRVGNAADPTAAYRVPVTDGSRTAPVVTPPAPIDEDQPQ